MYGVTVDGFIKKDFDTILEDVKDLFRDEFTNINLDEDAFAGHLANIFSKELSDLWDAMQAVYDSQYPSAEGVALDDVSDLVGIQRLAATKSLVTVLCFGTQGTTIPVSTLFRVIDTNEQFITLDSIDIDKAVAAECIISVKTVLNSTLYTITINGTNYDYMSDTDATNLEIIAGLKAAIDLGNEPVTVTDNLDGTCTIINNDIDTSFSFDISVDLQIDKLGSSVKTESVNSGPIVALSGTLINILTPVSGLDSIINRFDADLGRNTETDSELRTRRLTSLQVAGYATVESIKARIKQITGVTGVVIIENKTTVPDIDGRPGKSYETVVAGGLDATIASVLWETKPAGIETYGSLSFNVTDSQGVLQLVKFSRATEVYCWLKVTITKYTEENFPTDGATQITAKIVEYGNTLEINNDVILQRFHSYIYEIPGIATALVEIATSVTEVGPPGAYDTNNLAISSTQVAVFDTTRVTILGA